MRLLLDTAILIFAAKAPERLTRRASSVLSSPENTRELSTVSLSEIAIKAARGKLEFSLDDIRRAIDDLCIRILPYTADHAFRLFEVPLHHPDPFDRQLIAQSLCENIPVMTSDQKFGLYKGVEIIW